MSDITVTTPAAFVAPRSATARPAPTGRVELSPLPARHAVGLDSGLERFGVRRRLRSLLRIPFLFDHR